MATDEEKVAELRKLVADDLSPYYDRHHNLMRWIDFVPGGPMEKVAYKLRHHLRMRKCLDMDSMHKHPRNHPVHKYWPSNVVGMSGVVPNCLVYVEQCGYIDYFGIMDHFSIVDIVKAKMYDAEKAAKFGTDLEKETGQRLRGIFVADLENVQYSLALLNLASRGIVGAEFAHEHYVEVIKYIVAVNVPPWAEAVWKIFKPLMPGKTADTVRVLSSSNWREEIKAYMDPSICPTFWNGKGHNEFKLELERPPKVLDVQIPKTPSNLEILTVKAGQQHWFEFKLKKGDVINFALKSSSSFGFGILLIENEDEKDVIAMRPIFPVCLWMPGPINVPIVDSAVAPKKGLYKAWISNSRSWVSSLTVHQRFTVVKAEKTRL